MSSIDEARNLILEYLKENITETLSGKEMKYEVSEISDGSFTIKSDEMIIKQLLEANLTETLDEVVELIGKDMVTVHSPPPEETWTPDVPVSEGLLEWIVGTKLASAENTSERLAIDALPEAEREHAVKNIGVRIMRARDVASSIKKFGKQTGIWLWTPIDTNTKKPYRQKHTYGAS